MIYPVEEIRHQWSPATIRSLRDRLGMTQHAFALRIGTYASTVSRWETGASKPRGLYAQALDALAKR